MSEDDLVTGREAAQLCGVKPATIRGWVHRGYLEPVAVECIGGAPNLYRRCDVERCDEMRRRRLERASR